MHGRRRTGLTAVAILAAAVALGVATAGGASARVSTRADAIAGSLAASANPAAFWTAKRRRAAEPLSVVLSEGDTPATKASTSSIEGVDTGESTAYPNRANGKVYGVYEIHGRDEEYECSGSVVDSTYGDVVLTAGHCVIDPETGAVAKDVVFVPGYREGSDPYGVWTAVEYVTTEAWKETAGSRDPNEGGDLAFLVLEDNSGSSVEETVGSLSIAFDQERSQTYTQWGYPAESPYSGEILYSHTTAYAGTDTNDTSFSPAPIRIASDFTGGSSGGPWTIGSTSSPTVVSVTDYGYEEEPGYIYGAYFGEAARQAYESAAGVVVAAGTEDGVDSAAESSASTSSSSGSSTASTSTRKKVELRIRSIRRHPASGTATITVAVGAAGTLSLRGSGIAAEAQTVGAAGTRRLTVRGKGRIAAALSSRGNARVSIRIRLATGSGSRHLSRTIRLVER
ncbi:MAG: trypsin-like peptidase domain-containing protein [Solirubrobacterales bacterium]